MIIFSDVFDATKHVKYKCANEMDCLTPWTFLILTSTENGINIPFTGNYHQCGHSTKNDAEKFREFLIKSFDQCIFIVNKNADFTEGRGPMIFDKAFKHFDNAHSYVMDCDGIYGSKQYIELTYGCNIFGQLFGIASYNGYEITCTNFSD